MGGVILVIGATGVFGSRLVERLALTSETTILVGARSPKGIDHLIARLSALELKGTLRPCVIDRERVTAADLRALGAHIVVDAAGPFQGQDLQLPEAAIAAGCHFIDLADARDYVARFASLNESARRAGVLAVCGASSTPAISHAALDSFARDLCEPGEVAVYITPGNRAPRGLSVVRAILSYVGRAVSVFEHGRFRDRPGWSLLHRRRLTGLSMRWFSLCETPDLDLIPARFVSVKTARFYAGLELGVLHCGLWTLSWLVRMRLLRSLSSLAAPLHWIASRFEKFGTDRGGMLVEASGSDAQGNCAIAQWGLVAEAGDGPFIPTLPALALIRKLVQGAEATVGAQACVGLLSIEEIVREFDGLGIRAHREIVAQRSLFEKVIGDAFAIMPAPIRSLHKVREPTTFTGVASVDGAATGAGRLIAKLFGFPAASATCPVSVTIAPEGETEVWRRQFGAHRFRSRLAATPTQHIATEQFGALRIWLRIAGTHEGLWMHVIGAKLGLLPLPRALCPWTVAHERIDATGRFTFDVEIGLPLLGRLVRYRGWLESDVCRASDCRDEQRVRSSEQFSK